MGKDNVSKKEVKRMIKSSEMKDKKQDNKDMAKKMRAKRMAYKKGK